VFGIFVALFGKKPARSLFLYVPGRVRHLVLLAEHADARGAADPDRAMHGLPAQLGMVIIGGEGALLIGALAATSAALIAAWAPPLVVQLAMAAAGMIGGGSGSCCGRASPIPRRQ
jgi:hypothetical protein